MNYLNLLNLIKNPFVSKVLMYISIVCLVVYSINTYTDYMRLKDRKQFEDKLTEINSQIAIKELLIDDLKTEILSLNLTISENNKKINSLELKRSKLSDISNSIKKETITDEDLFNKAKEILSKFNVDTTKFSITDQCNSRN